MMNKSGKYLTDFQRKLLEKNLHKSRYSKYHHRIRIMLLADMGYNKTQISENLGCTKETARYWIAQARSGQAHNWQECPLGRPKTVNTSYLDRLKELASNSPRDYGYAFERWTGHWLSKHLKQELEIEVSPRHVNRLLKQMGMSARAKSANRSASLDSMEKSNLRLQELSSACDRATAPYGDRNSSQKWQLNFLG